MGLIEPMAITNVMSGVIPFGSSMGLFIAMTGILAAAVSGILLSLPRRPRPARALRLVRPATVNLGLSS